MFTFRLFFGKLFDFVGVMSDLDGVVCSFFLEGLQVINLKLELLDLALKL